MGSFRHHIDELINLGAAPSGGDTEPMIKVALNNAYRQILGQSNQEQRHREFSLTTVANIAKYGLPLYVKAVRNIEDTANRRQIYKMTSEKFDNLFAGRTETNDPRFYYPFGNRGVEKQPSAVGTVTVESDVATDDGSRFVTLVGFDANGILRREKLTLNGTTLVASTVSFDPDRGGIDRTVKSTSGSAEITGNVTIKDAAANVLSRIPTWVESPTYLWIEFDWIPSITRTYVIRARALKPDLVNDEDWPEFDENFHNLLTFIAGAQVLPALGKQALADRFNVYAFGSDGGSGLMHTFLSDGDPQEGDVFTMANVQMSSVRLPHRQRIIGVDFGRVSN